MCKAAKFVECKYLAALGIMISKYLRKDFRLNILTPKFVCFRVQ